MEDVDAIGRDLVKNIPTDKTNARLFQPSPRLSTAATGATPSPAHPATGGGGGGNEAPKFLHKHTLHDGDLRLPNSDVTHQHLEFLPIIMCDHRVPAEP